MFNWHTLGRRKKYYNQRRLVHSCATYQNRVIVKKCGDGAAVAFYGSRPLRKEMLCLVGRNWLDRAYHYFLILATQECQNKKSRTMGSWINCQKKRHKSVILELRFFLTDMTRRFDWANQSIIVERHRKRIDVTSTAATMLCSWMAGVRWAIRQSARNSPRTFWPQIGHL